MRIFEKKKTGLILAMACFLTTGSQAQTKVLNLQQCLDMAYLQNLEVKAANMSVERAKVLQGTAWDLDKTEVALSQDPSSGGNTDNALSFSQSIEFPTVYAARHGQLKAETQAERSKVNVVKSELAFNVKSLYYQLVYEAECMKLMNHQDSMLSRCRTIAEKRYKAGDARKLEYLAVERKYRENKLDIAEKLSEIEKTQLELKDLLNSEMPIEPADKALKALDFVQTGFNYQQTPEGQLAQDRIKASDKAITVAKNGYAPSLSLALRSQLVISSWNPYNVDRSRFKEGNFFGFEVGVGVPLFYGATKARVKAAKKDKEIAQLEMQQEQQSLQRDYLATLSRCNSTFARLSFYQNEGDAQHKEMEKLSLLEYENGEISYVEYLDALDGSIDYHIKRAAAINDYNQSVIALEKLMGNNK